MTARGCSGGAQAPPKPLILRPWTAGGVVEDVSRRGCEEIPQEGRVVSAAGAVTGKCCVIAACGEQFCING